MIARRFYDIAQKSSTQSMLFHYNQYRVRILGGWCVCVCVCVCVCMCVWGFA